MYILQEANQSISVLTRKEAIEKTIGMYVPTTSKAELNVQIRTQPRVQQTSVSVGLQCLDSGG